MKSTLVSLVVAGFLVAAGAVLWSRGRTEQALASLHGDLATMQFSSVASGADEFESTFAAIAVPGQEASARTAARGDRAAADYWLASYSRLTDARGVQGSGTEADAAQLLLATNAAYRAAEREAVDKATAVSHLESVIKSYAEVLKAHPDDIDAAYNYELVVRLRNALAKSGPTTPKPEPAPAGASTIHGKTGAPPKGVNLAGFRILIPGRTDDRDNGPEAGKGGPKQRKG